MNMGQLSPFCLWQQNVLAIPAEKVCRHTKCLWFVVLAWTKKIFIFPECYAGYRIWLLLGSGSSVVYLGNNPVHAYLGIGPLDRIWSSHGKEHAVNYMELGF